MTEPRNRVVQVRRFGDADGLEVADAPLPTSRQGEVRVRGLASAVEYTDVLIRRHLYPQTSLRRPAFVIGYDVVGEIDQLADGVRDFQVGDRVADMTVVGSNAAYRTLRADRPTRVPAGLDAAEAATLILSWMTAYQLLGCGANMRHADMRVGSDALPSGSEYRVPDRGRTFALNPETPQAELFLTDAVHQFNAGDRDRRVTELLEPKHDSNALLDAAVVLLNHVVEVF
jgi:Alcohol dehydrogenase GroES-like domain